MLQRHPDDDWRLAAPRPVSRRTRRVLVALADAILPEQPRVETTLDDVVEHALVSLQYMPRSSASAFLLGMRLLNWSPIWRLRGVRPLTAVDRKRARDHLRAVSQSRWLPVRMLMVGPLGLFMSTYFDQDYAHEAIGYDPVPFVQERIDRRRRLLGEAEANPDEGTPRLPVVPP